MISITILGNNSAIPAFNRHPTAQFITIGKYSFLMDCGEGTQSQIHKYGLHPGRISHIFISHLHGDHYFGLVGLLSSFSLWNRQQPLHLYAQPILKDIIDLQFHAINAQRSYELIFHPIENQFSGILFDTEAVSVSTFPVQHGVPCHGFIFREKADGRKINPEACQTYGVPTSYFSKLKNGADFIGKNGLMVKNQTLTFDAPSDKVYAFCADTVYDTSIVPSISKVGLLYHESTFLNDDKDKALKRFHSTAEQAANIALAANVEQLLLGHYSSRYQDIKPFEMEARRVFANSEASIEGKTYFLK